MKKIISIVLALLMLASFAVAVSAQKDLAEWTLSDGDKILSNGSEEFILYPDFSMEDFYPAEAYVLEGVVTSEDFTTYDVVFPKPDGDIICLAETNNWYESLIYVSADGKKTLDALQNGIYGHARIHNYLGNYIGFGGYGEIDIDFLSELDSFEGEVLEMNVKELADIDIIPVYVYDTTDTIRHYHGGIYVDEEVYYYINYDALDNSYFDAEGDFSYRKGTVSVLKLDGNAIAVLNEVSTRLENRYTEYDYTYSEGSDLDLGIDTDDFTGDGARIVFWIISAIFGAIVPIGIGIFGMIMALSKKPGKNKRWLVIPILSLLWMAVFAAIILVLII